MGIVLNKYWKPKGTKTAKIKLSDLQEDIKIFLIKITSNYKKILIEKSHSEVSEKRGLIKILRTNSMKYNLFPIYHTNELENLKFASFKISKINLDFSSNELVLSLVMRRLSLLE